MKKKLYIALSLMALVATGCSDDGLSDWEDQSGTSASVHQWTRAEDVETRKAFLRNFGVGYGYNAVRGEYCNWRDIRCQVVNRRELERQASFGNAMWGSVTTEAIQTNQKTTYSQRDYVQTMELTTKESLDLGLYAETTRTRQYVMEEGLQDNFYYSTEERILKGEQYIQPQMIMEKVEDDDDENLLTQSFQEAVEYLAYADEEDYAVLDSFVNVWGTHVIVRSHLGASLRLDLKNNMWRYTDYVQNEKFTSEQLMMAYNNRKDERKKEEKYTFIENSSLYISARGGDQSVLGNLIGEARYDGTRDFNMSDVGNWRLSVKYDPTDEVNSNVEMIGMEVVPIWDFVKYEHVRRRLKVAILQDVALQQELLGDRNFFNASFPIYYPQAKARYQQTTGKWTTITRTDSPAEPMVVNIVSGGRYVATVCHEQLLGYDLWVCYPIYEGKVKLACGVGVTPEGRCYQVRWLNSELPQLTRLEQYDNAARTGGKFYITGGAIGVEPQEDVAYTPSFAIPYVEVAGGVQPAGGFDIPAYYTVLKQNHSFCFWMPENGPATVVGWTASGQKEGTRQQYTRNTEYIYIYNPTELTYE